MVNLVLVPTQAIQLNSLSGCGREGDVRSLETRYEGEGKDLAFPESFIIAIFFSPSQSVRFFVFLSPRNNNNFFASFRVQFGLLKLQASGFSLRKPTVDFSTSAAKVGSTLAKVAALRLNLNIDGSPITSTTHTHLRCENRPANRPASRETGLEMPCCPPNDLLWVQITQSYPNRLRFSSLPCPQSPCHDLIFHGLQEGFF
jgi:hypothetical protein